jgi:NhaP-type Na+/H+ or K+/H+ antiporter
VSITIIAVRFIWVFVATYLPRLLWAPWRARNPAPSWQSVFIVGFTGIRGVVSLAAVLSIPLMAGSAPFPDRGLLLLVTFCVILVTLVGQGFTFPWLIQVLGLVDAGRREANVEKRQEVAGRVASIDAALARLDAMEGAVSSPETVEMLKRRHADRRAYFTAACEDIINGEVALSSAALQLRFLDAERTAMNKLYYDGALSDEARRRIERELDLDESRIRHVAESGTIRD